MQRIKSQDAVADALLGLLYEFFDARDFGVQRARTNQAHDRRNMHRVMCLACRLVREAKRRERGRCGLGLPHRLDRCELHLLMLCRKVAAFVAQDNYRQRGRQTE